MVAAYAVLRCGALVREKEATCEVMEGCTERHSILLWQTVVAERPMHQGRSHPPPSSTPLQLPAADRHLLHENAKHIHLDRHLLA